MKRFACLAVICCIIGLRPVVAGGAGVPGAPLEGPLYRVLLTITDDKSTDDSDMTASAYAGEVAGQPLPGSTTNVTIAILDSGAGTHLVGYPDALAFGLQGAYLSPDTFQAGGIGGMVDVNISMPAGFFACGLQHYAGPTNVPSAEMYGQGNFCAGVNTEANYLTTNDVPTVVGTPFLAYFAASILADQRVEIVHNGKKITSASVNFYDNPDDPEIPQLAHRVFMAVTPTAALTVQYLGLDMGDGLEIFAPSVIGYGSAFFTASSMTFTKSGVSTGGKVMIDTAAQATLISEIAAAELGLDLKKKEFEIEIQGVAGMVKAPGFYLDEVRIPALGGALVWTNVPVVVLNIPSPEGGTLFGILGTNLLGTRNVVFNGIATTPYLDVSDPVISPSVQITGLRYNGDLLQVDWLSDPAAPLLTLQQCNDLLTAPPVWTTIATGDLATVTGTFSTTNVYHRAYSYFRVLAQ